MNIVSPPGQDELLESYDPKAVAKIVPLAKAYTAERPEFPFSSSRLELREHFLRTFPTAEAVEQFLKTGTLPPTFYPALRRVRSGLDPVHDIARELYAEQKNVLPDRRPPMRTPDPLRGLENLTTSGAIVFPSQKTDILSAMGVPAVFSTLIEIPFRYPDGYRMEGHLFLTLPPDSPRWALDAVQVAGNRLAQDKTYCQSVERLAVYVHDLPENSQNKENHSWFRERLALVGSVQTIRGQPTFDTVNPMYIPYRPAVIDQNVHTELMASMGEGETSYSRSLIGHFNDAANGQDEDRVQTMSRINHSHLHHTLRAMRRATWRNYGTLPEEPAVH